MQEAYEIWEAKLPKNYKEIMQDSKLKESYSTMAKKDIHDILSKGIPLQDDKRVLSSLLYAIQFVYMCSADLIVRV